MLSWLHTYNPTTQFQIQQCGLIVLLIVSPEILIVSHCSDEWQSHSNDLNNKTTFFANNFLGGGGREEGDCLFASHGNAVKGQTEVCNWNYNSVCGPYK